MSRVLQIRRGSDTENDSFSGSEGELTIDLTNNELRLHNGDEKKGGHRIGRATDITNCITEISQDIKIQFSENKLTIKSGSKLYYPNGVKNFSTIVLKNDETTTITGTGTFILFRRNAVGQSGYFAATHNQIHSGTPTQSTIDVFYDTDSNRIDWYSNGVRNDRLFSLPICEITTENNKIKHIDNVFNGIGYIGKTIYALPGIYGLCPNGRYNDGSLKNKIVQTKTVLTHTESGAARPRLSIILSENSIGHSSVVSYDEITNMNLINGTQSQGIICGTLSKTTDGTISNFLPVISGRILGYNDTSFISRQSMPGDKYIDLTMGATNTYYTAPADGYYTWAKITNGVNQYCGMVNETSGLIRSVQWCPISNGGCEGFIPVRQGDSCKLIYSAGGATIVFRFVFAQGAR